jgi:hypothetical protein
MMDLIVGLISVACISIGLLGHAAPEYIARTPSERSDQVVGLVRLRSEQVIAQELVQAKQ